MERKSGKIAEHISRLHTIWASVRRGWYDYLSIPVTMIAYVSIIEYLVLSFIPPLKNFLSGGALLAASVALFLLACYLLGKRASSPVDRRCSGSR